MALVLFDLLHLGGKTVMREPWRDRRKRLEDLLEGRQLPRIAAVVPVTMMRPAPPSPYETWVPAILSWAEAHRSRLLAELVPPS
jgi:hypothetical protein